MRVIYIKLFSIFLVFFSLISANINEYKINDLLISTVPSLSKELVIEEVEMTPYKKGKLPKLMPGYYFLKGNIEVDTLLEVPSILLTPGVYPFYLYINKKEILRWGEGKESVYYSYYNAKVINITHVVERSNINEFLFCFYTDGDDTPLPIFKIGEYNDLSNKAFYQTFFNLQLITGLVVCSFLAAILFLGYFLVSGKKEMEVLYFVLASFFFVLAYLNMVLSSQNFNELLLVKLSRFSLLVIPFFLLRFVQSYTNVFKRFIKLFWIPLYIAIIAGFYMLFLPEKNDVDLFFAYLQILVAIPELLLILTILLIDLGRNRKKDKYIILAGFIVMSITALRDIYYSSNGLLPYMWIIPYGFFAQLFSIALSITIRQRELYISTLDFKNRLEEANIQIQSEASKRERFLDTIAMELRSPMNGLEERIQDIEKEKSLTFNSLSGSFRRIRITLNNIFDYVAIRDGHLRILNHDFNLYSTLDILNGFYFEMAKKKDLSFSMLYDKEFVPQYIHGDREHLIQIIDNLLHNAIKYTKEGGVTCTISYRKGEFIFAVSDTGEGINEEGKTAFRKAISTSEYISFSEKYEGVGMGLAITDMIVRKMHGRINIESHVDQGTTILVTIPLEEKELKENKTVKENTGNVLVVEDNKVNALIITKLLKKSGYDYKTVENGLLAVQAAQKETFSVILMDIEMPVMDGLEATRKIRQFDQKTPIIAVTANGQYGDCIDAGMNDHLMKPVNFEYLKEILRKHTYTEMAV